MASYAIEAKLLKAKDFPPLKRPLDAYINTTGVFFGHHDEANALTAVMELKITSAQVHIQSLVVHPDHFRKGIGTKLMQYVFDSYQSDEYLVETGVDNAPACLLYKKHGFQEVHQWDTDHGVRKIRFIKS